MHSQVALPSHFDLTANPNLHLEMPSLSVLLTVQSGFWTHAALDIYFPLIIIKLCLEVTF